MTAVQADTRSVQCVSLNFLNFDIVNPEIKASVVMFVALKPNLSSFHFRITKKETGGIKKTTPYTGVWLQ